jgi:hypothetical protein
VGALVLALASAGCGSSASQASPAWSFAAAPSATAVPTPVSSPSEAPTPAPTASVSPARGLASTCAAQWAASLTTYEDGDAGAISAVLLPRSGMDAPAVEPTAATLQTDKGPLELGVAMVSSDENDTLWGTTRLDLGLPVLKAGTYRTQFLELADASGTWRFRVGEFVIDVLPGSAPKDLERTGGTIETGAFEGGSVQGFEIGLRNTTGKPIEVTGASTDIPGLPVTWVLVERDPVRMVDSVPIPAGRKVTVTFGTENTEKPVSFVLATPEIAYRVGDAAERRAVFDPIEFQSGFGQPSDVTAYGATLPGDACAQQP